MLPLVILSDSCVGANDDLIHSRPGVLHQEIGVKIILIGVTATEDGPLKNHPPRQQKSQIPGFDLILCTFFHRNLLGTVNSE